MKSFDDNKGIILENRLRLARVEENLTQGELAKMSGVTRQTIGAIESGKFNPTAKLALIFCVILDKKFEELFYFNI